MGRVGERGGRGGARGERGRVRGRGVVKEVALPQTWEICGFAQNVRNRWLCPTYFVVHSSIIKSIHRGCDCEGA